jgi:hypothetical protein
MSDETLAERFERERAAYMKERWAEVRRLRMVAIKAGAQAAGLLVLIVLLVTLPLARAMGLI